MESTLFLISLLTIGSVFGGNPEKLCSNPADIVFVLDESGSIYGLDFKKQLDFVQKVIDTFDVGYNKIRVGVMTFATEPRIIFSLNQYTEEQALKNAVKNITQARGQTYTHLALKRLRQEMFSQNIARPGVDHIAIVITDGDSDNPPETAKEAQFCHDANIEVFAIGVGRQVSRKELEAIASSDKYVFTAESYSALGKLVDILAGRDCPTPPPPITTKAPAIEGCKGQRTMDHIWSISDQGGVEETILALNFIKDVTREMKINPDHIQVGLAPKFCDEGKEILLKDHDTREGFWNGLDKRLLKGLRTDRTLAYIRQQGFISSNGGRSNAVKYGILIVDNRFEDWEKTLREAQLAKEEKVQLIVIGVGDRVEKDKLRQLGSSSAHYFFVENYRKLAEKKASIIQTICKDISNMSVKLREFFEQYYNY